MSLKRKKQRVFVGFIALVLISTLCSVFAFACYAGAGAGIHTTFVHQKLTEEERIFIYSVMREQLLQVSTVLGALVLLWAVFAVIAWRLWIRASERIIEHDHTTA